MDNPKSRGIFEDLPQHIIIDKSSANLGGWYHLGNMYWCPEYKSFYQWLDHKKIESQADFPHDHFRFLSAAYEEEFLNAWAPYIRIDETFYTS